MAETITTVVRPLRRHMIDERIMRNCLRRRNVRICKVSRSSATDLSELLPPRIQRVLTAPKPFEISATS
ncbi:hypothetical protein SAMN05518866_108130 [Sphingobium sp. YR768]|nr:hypothetical protein SAMN05518866_108130 [Sphingobium sp. YR768]